MPTRLVLFGFNLALMVFIVRILCIGHNFDKKPLSGCRKRMVFFIVRLFCRILLWLAGIRLSVKDMDYDYSEYLGPKYKSDPKRSP